ncbi:MAG TPA: Gmad2 immunoglobulin-like domain-containing protein [Kineosporiaceae bacterium]|nr:Gmad2 immunoglobulin-like domain-containing protein [Kineosporiaceae bacterium]
MTVQLDRSQDVWLDANGVPTPGRRRARPLTRRERRDRERDAAFQVPPEPATTDPFPVGQPHLRGAAVPMDPTVTLPPLAFAPERYRQPVPPQPSPRLPLRPSGWGGRPAEPYPSQPYPSQPGYPLEQYPADHYPLATDHTGEEACTDEAYPDDGAYADDVYGDEDEYTCDTCPDSYAAGEEFGGGQYAEDGPYLQDDPYDADDDADAVVAAPERAYQRPYPAEPYHHETDDFGSHPTSALPTHAQTAVEDLDDEDPDTWDPQDEDPYDEDYPAAQAHAPAPDDAAEVPPVAAHLPDPIDPVTDPPVTHFSAQHRRPRRAPAPARTVHAVVRPPVVVPPPPAAEPEQEPEELTQILPRIAMDPGRLLPPGRSGMPLPSGVPVRDDPAAAAGRAAAVTRTRRRPTGTEAAPRTAKASRKAAKKARKAAAVRGPAAFGERPEDRDMVTTAVLPATPAAPPRKARRGAWRSLLAALALVGVAAGVFGGLRLGQELVRARAQVLGGSRLPAPSAAPSAAGTTGSGELDRAATAATAGGLVDGMPRAAGAGAGQPAAQAGAGRTSLYVYWVTGSANRALLARELRSVTDYGDPLLSAVQAVLRERPLDPDYATPWRPATSVQVRSAGDGITVVLSPDAFAAPGISPAVAGAAVQQLVWTVTAAAQRDVPVTLQATGATGYRAWGSVVLGQPVRRDVGARAAVWIDTPLEASSQPGTVRVSGQGAAFEATYRWQVSQDGHAVASGVAAGTASGPGTGWSTFSVDVLLPPGSYQLTVTAENPGQAEQPPGWTWPDTRSFRVG